MARHADTAESREFQALGTGLLLYSVMFLPLLGYGWYVILGDLLPGALAALGAAVVAALAWTLARIVGSSEDGIAGNKAFFAALLIVSAVGVFNTLMIRLEGRAIFTEAIDQASARYAALPRLAQGALVDADAAALRRRVDALRTQLAQEIRNPRNCGEGPEAARLIARIKAELPGLVRYSGRAGDCSNNAELIRMYDAQIDTLLQGSDAFVRGRVQVRDALRRRVETASASELARLTRLRRDVDAGASLLGAVRPALEESAATYAGLASALAQQAPALDARVLPTGLDLRTVRHLGEWGHLLPLLLSRLDRPQTWVYLGLAAFLDWLLVHLFARLAAHRRAQPRPRAASPVRLETPW